MIHATQRGDRDGTESCFGKDDDTVFDHRTVHRADQSQGSEFGPGLDQNAKIEHVRDQYLGKEIISPLNCSDQAEAPKKTSKHPSSKPSVSSSSKVSFAAGTKQVSKQSEPLKELSGLNQGMENLAYIQLGDDESEFQQLKSAILSMEQFARQLLGIVSPSKKFIDEFRRLGMLICNSIYRMKYEINKKYYNKFYSAHLTLLIREFNRRFWGGDPKLLMRTLVSPGMYVPPNSKWGCDENYRYMYIVDPAGNCIPEYLMSKESKESTESKEKTESVQKK